MGSETRECTCGLSASLTPPRGGPPWWHAETCAQYQPAPTAAEIKARYQRARKHYEEARERWRDGGRIGPPPPCPVPPHTPGWRGAPPSPEEERE